jgi:hypothetical protein
MTKTVKAGDQDGYLTARTIREADEAADWLP